MSQFKLYQLELSLAIFCGAFFATTVFMSFTYSHVHVEFQKNILLASLQGFVIFVLCFHMYCQTIYISCFKLAFSALKAVFLQQLVIILQISVEIGT